MLSRCSVPSCLLLALLLVCAGCSPRSDVQPPPQDAGFDYQIGGPYPAAQDARIVIRDRLAEPEPGRYNICYVNGYQAQPGEEEVWRDADADLLLSDAQGEPVIDTDWDERLLDLSTPERRDGIAAIVGGWMRGCAQAGFDAVEVDNLDSWTRSAGLLSREDALALARLFVERAHREGLAIGQKNAAEIAPQAAAAGFDFAVTEECARYDECATYTAAYPGRVLDIEYREQDLRRACAGAAEGASVILRDRDVLPDSSAGHTRATC
ncbi:endo alpha-1,4 polygalactosaminidase [Marinactinospora thermotolerans]|uniref:Uncharacterized conserved protein n=1 Tax=Marinactinospora thermotolerans DSM 45154 TaxID=1122192 RepID=A0A1T4S6H5_9ACTN|nr:endo alpha-1,4 polygalactosaminidase [Marinactinospora thermotolerans]SKA23843.1 Uncharacterized conserved protein [Marinactinospora thermotolerans DSM 45154]